MDLIMTELRIKERARDRARFKARTLAPGYAEKKRAMGRKHSKARWLREKNNPKRIAKKLAYDIAYREENRAAISAKEKARVRDPKYMKEKARATYLKNLDKMKSRNAVYRSNPANRMKMRGYWKKYADTHKWVASKKNARRKALKLKCKTDGTANIFYKFVRSKKIIPCYYCGEEISGLKAHVDHIVALSSSGNHSSENLCASCPKCNLSKSDKSVTEWKIIGQTLLPI